MTALALLDDLGTRGVRLTVDGGRLTFDAPAGTMTPELRERLKVHKGELVAILAGKAAPEAPAQLESRADRELARFERVAIPRPDGRGWYDPGTPWRVIQQLDAANRAMAARIEGNGS